MSDSLVDRLREEIPSPYVNEYIAEPNTDELMKMCRDAADLIEFFLSQMQASSVHMNGQHQWRFRSGGWPMTHCVGPTAIEAAFNAVSEIKAQRTQVECAQSR